MTPDKRLWIYSGLALAQGVGLASPRATPSPPSPPLGLFVCGDSMAQGLGPPLQQLGRESGVPVQVLARRGSSIAQWAASPPALDAAGPVLVLVALGTDDWVSGRLVLTDWVLALLEAFRTVPGRLVWIAPPRMPVPDVRGVRHALSQTVPRHALLFHTEALAIPRISDGIHPTAAGYAGLAGVLWRRLGVDTVVPMLSPAKRRKRRASVVPP